MNLDSQVRMARLLLPSSCLCNSLTAHRYHYLTTRAALSAPITRRSQGYDHHRRCDKLHQEVQVLNVLQGTSFPRTQ